MSKLHSSFLFAAADKYLSTVITLLTTAVAARLLTPDEIGVFAICSVFIMLSETVRDFGTSVYIIQARELRHETVRTAFTIMMLLAAVLVACLMAAAPPIASFYADRRVMVAIELAAAGLLLTSLAAPCLALLRREMNFSRLAVVNVGGMIVNLLAFVAFYFMGYGYLSLILASLAASAAAAVIGFASAGHLWMLHPCLAGWRPIAGFGGLASATALLNTLYTSLPQLLLGRFAGIDAAGLYTRATILAQLPDRLVVGAFQPVVLPAFSARARASGDLRPAYLRAVTMLSAVQWPALAGLALLAEPAVRIVLGPQWDSIAPLLRILAVAGLFMMPACLTYPVLVASGQIRDTLLLSLISLPASAVILIAAAPFGMKAVALSMLVGLPLQMFIALVAIRRRIGFSWGALFAATWKGGVVSLTACLVPAVFAARYGMRPNLPLPMLALLAFGMAAGWLAGLWATRHPLLDEARSALSLLRRKGPPTHIVAEQVR